MITASEARDEIFTLFKTTWDAGSPSLVGYVPTIEWQGVQPRGTPVASKHWCRASLQNVSEGQASLSISEGAPGRKRYTAFGLVFVQIFSPRSEANGFENGLLLSQVAKGAFRGKTTPGKVWFRNVRMQELEPEDSFYRLNVVAEFEYDEVS